MTIRLTEEHGIYDYPLGDVTLHLHAAARQSEDEEPTVTITATAPVTVELHYGNKIKTLKIEP